MHTYVHACKHGPTRSHLAYGKESPKRQDLREGPGSRKVLLLVPHPPCVRETQPKLLSLRTRVRPSPGQEENRIQRRKTGKAQQWWLVSTPQEKVPGRLVCSPEQTSVFTAQPLRRLEDTLWTAGLNLLGDSEWQSLGRPIGIWSSLPSCPSQATMQDRRLQALSLRPAQVPSHLQGPTGLRRETQPGLWFQS